MSIKKLRPTSDNFAEHQQESSALKSSGGSPVRGSANSIAGENILRPARFGNQKSARRFQKAFLPARLVSF
jgi:hypothetical protein